MYGDSIFIPPRNAHAWGEPMRIGLIADIHGNLVALDAVLAELERARVDAIVCLGDGAALGPQPRQVMDRLRELNCRCVMSNTDAWLLPDPPMPAMPATTAPVRDVTGWCASHLSNADLTLLRAFPATIDLSLDGGRRLRCCHGSPRSVDDVVAATTPAAELDAMQIREHSAIYAGGHTHVQLLRRHGDALVINPGSIGLPGVGPGGPDLPVNQQVSWAEFAVLSVGGEHTSVDLRRTAIDVERALAVAAASGMPHVAWWASKWAAPA